MSSDTTGNDMERFVIEFSLDNFDNKQTGVIQAMKHVKEKVRQGMNAGNIFDVNGNSIGTFYTLRKSPGDHERWKQKRGGF